MECERKNNYRADKTVSGKKSFSVKVQFEASEDLLGPDDLEVDLRRILKEARDDRGRNIFETFGFEGLELPGGGVVQMEQIQKKHH